MKNGRDVFFGAAAGIMAIYLGCIDCLFLVVILLVIAKLIKTMKVE